MYVLVNQFICSLFYSLSVQYISFQSNCEFMETDMKLYTQLSNINY